ILDRRLDKTLDEIGQELGVTRERIRQIEYKTARALRPQLAHWAGSIAAPWLSQLSSAAVSETELFSNIVVATLPAAPQYRLAALALRILFPGAHTPGLGATRGVARGLWTNSPEALGGTLRSIAKACPFSSEDFELYLRHAGISSGLLEPLRAQERGAIRYHAGASAWVRSNAVHRDAATHILRQAGKPMASTALAGPLGINARAVVGNLVRDDRFRQLRPSGEWALSEWLTDEQARAGLETTLDAVISVLRSDGPLKRTALIGRVVEIYPVSAWSVMNTLESDLVGLTADGRIDLTERGATPMPLRIPRRPDYVVVANGIVILRRRVDREMLHGSGIATSRYVGWAVGLERPGEARTFVSPGQPDLIVRRGFGNSSVSSIRQQVTELEASLGDTAAIEITLSTDTYRIVIEK
ncbi:MAG: hypothetical protein EXQ69_09160, partial [Acidimicrobiia bacterium]|nr:hypothetical protein [Acidimicrobiia bacterium]